MTTVTARELRNNLSRYLSLLEEGEQITIVRRGRVLGTMQPQARPPKDVEEGLQRMVREGKITWSGKKFTPEMPTVKLEGDGPTASEMIIEGRG